jgi:hypothetical protein
MLAGLVRRTLLFFFESGSTVSFLHSLGTRNGYSVAVDSIFQGPELFSAYAIAQQTARPLAKTVTACEVFTMEKSDLSSKFYRRCQFSSLRLAISKTVRYSTFSTEIELGRANGYQAASSCTASS